MNRRNFNMIEILLAMSVIAIGFLSVISLLSIGLKTHRKAQDNFYVNLAAETMANYIKSECELYDLSIYLRKEGELAAKTRSFGHDTGYLTSDEMAVRDNDGDKEIGNLGLPEPLEFEDCDFEGGEILIPDSKLDRNFPKNFTLTKSGKSTPLGAENSKGGQGGNKGDKMSKYHHMQWTTTVDNEQIPEFDCLATVAITPYVGMKAASGTRLNATSKDASMLVVRIEWPAEASIDNRNSREFQYYVY